MRPARIAVPPERALRARGSEALPALGRPEEKAPIHRHEGIRGGADAARHRTLAPGAVAIANRR